ncbi:MAG: DUF4492 domain-containing protein [Sulfurimonas sp.]|nr:DUF4492 domain-containing protein [Sulfurimonas sp.]
MLVKIFYFYYDGFRNMKMGKQLWLIIIIKLFVMFAIIKVLFFPNQLKENFQTDAQRASSVIQHLTKE